MMSFMGSIGTMMKCSGLEDALGSVYGTNAFPHMLSGKVFSRALHGQFLIEAALTNKIINQTLARSYKYCDTRGGYGM